MAVNFCAAHHSPTIASNKVSSDGYEASNLVSSDERCRRRGFLAASFISPPVEIVISFPYSVDISHIMLCLRNGSQQTTAIKLYTQTSKEDASGVYHLICAKENVTESQIYFYNNRYRPSRLFSTFSYVAPKGHRLYPRQDSYVCCIRRLKVCLTKTASSSLPALSKLEVWGQPGIDCSEDVKQSIFRTELDVRTSLYKLSQDNSSHSSNSCFRDTESPKPKIEPPAEFLDSLTFEMMSQPILLPSGNNVDRQTLEKYIKTSSSWGRLPGDPFTGVAFSKTNQPVPNVELKTRIDQFWLTNPDSCSGGRCTGFTNRGKLKFSPFVANVSREDRVRDVDNQLEESKLDYKQRSAKRKYYGPSLRKSVQKKSHKMETNAEHAKELAASLKSSLRTVLDGRPSFLNAAATGDSDIADSNKCMSCDKESDLLNYSLPCSHLLCRSCVLNELRRETLQCKKCYTPFSVSSIVRYHE